MPNGVPRAIPLRYPLLLGACTALFVMRVLVQALVAVRDVDFLPPFERWYSGVLPYPLLLPAQIILAALMLKIVRDFARADGYFVNLQPRTGRILIGLGLLYALAMFVRYGLTMTIYPELRWFTGTIPIWFHFVLAAFVLTLGHYQLRRDRAARTGVAP